MKQYRNDPVNADATPAVCHSRCPEDTRRYARDMMTHLEPGTVLALHGDLGAGKTCFVKGLARAIGAESMVNSPTYTLINEYPGEVPVYHIDLYRIEHAGDALQFGLDDYIFGDGITAIEWAERVTDLLPASTIHIYLEAGEGPDDRLIRVCMPAPTEAEKHEDG